jgi:hypothetical protein
MLANLSVTDWMLILPTIGYAITIIARFTPNKTDDKLAQVVCDIINFIAMNHGKAKNADPTDRAENPEDEKSGVFEKNTPESQNKKGGRFGKST